MQKTTKPVVINNFLVNCILDKGEGIFFDDVLREMFAENIGNTDILINMINSFMDVQIVDGKLYFKDNHQVQKIPKEKVFLDIRPDDKRAFFEFFDGVDFLSSTGMVASQPVLIINENKLMEFILSTMKYLDKKATLKPIVPYAGTSSPIKVFKQDSFSLTGMFLESSIEDVRRRNIERQRWFEDKFILGEKEVFLSTQWSAQGNFQLTLTDFIEMVKCCYGPNYSYKKGPNGEHQLYLEGKNIIEDSLKNPLQQIFYGAPGTGKSNKIKKEIEDEGKPHIRTTFHPDSDYSTFVGAYKPTMKIENKYGLNGTNTIPMTYPNGEKSGLPIKESKIEYRFVPQAFLKAYTSAWKLLAEGKPYYLIIEEINRGNCAQIFGDLFQLLDRKDDGFSEYPIEADEDIRKFLQTDEEWGFVGLTDEQKSTIPEDVLLGEKMVLPKNLYIWATMNTSDQSLFPIDSAFKRRWDWEYIPITQSKDNKYKVRVDNLLYDWWTFVGRMNEVVKNATDSEDKKMGYYFCKADEEGDIISAKRFVNKVVFYLWNDVFKDNGFDWELDGKQVFKYTKEKENDTTMTFEKFFTEDGNPDTKVVKALMKNLGIPAVTESSEAQLTEEEKTNERASRKKLLVNYNGQPIEGESSRLIYRQAIEIVVAEKGAEEVARCLGADMTKEPQDNSRNYKQIADTEWYLATNNGVETYCTKLNKLKNELNLNIEVRAEDK